MMLVTISLCYSGLHSTSVLDKISAKSQQAQLGLFYKSILNQFRKDQFLKSKWS